MKVVLIYRRPKPDAFSIEELFRTVAVQLRQRQVEVIEYAAGNRWQLLGDVVKLRGLRADVYHVTGDVNYLVPFLDRTKTVLTVHDIGHYLFGLSHLKRWIYKWLWLMLPMRAARVVTTVSDETRKNIARHLGAVNRRIETIENCHGELFKPVARPFDGACPVILQIGTRAYKNVPRLLEALSGLQCRLVLVGGLTGELKSKLSQHGIRYLQCANLSREQVARQYAECDLVSFVSVGEGFGLPILEAQASGRPLITSDLSPMREVAGDGACLVDPLDVAAIRAGIRKIIDDADYRRQLVARGLKNAARYSPATVGDRYLELYRRMS